ncbi:MAG: low-density lipoprotein receptor-related protein 2 [Pseudomonadota bacterium]
MTCAGGLGASCGGDDEKDGDFCEQGASRLRECGLLSAGSSRCDIPAEEEDDASCSIACLVRAQCETLNAVFCTNEDPRTADSALLRDCTEDCTEQFGFRCPALGGAGAVPRGYVCDGEADCADSSDERDCETFDCGDGDVVPASWFCDGEADCSDGSDEGAGCEHLSCTDGRQLPASFQCDGFDDCGDGSDEAGCGLATSLCQ